MYDHQIYRSPARREQEEELELALELLEIRTDEELEEFLGKLVRSVGRGLQRFTRSPLGRSVTGVLRGVAKKALPVIGGAAGSFLAPGLGTAVGGQLGSMAANLLEAEELEVLSPAEAELEAARRYVRFARATTRGALSGPRNVPPRQAARRAATVAARRHAPALTRSRPAGGRPPSRPRPRPRPPWAGAPYPYNHPYPYAYPVPVQPVGDPYAGASEPGPWPGPDDPSLPPATFEPGPTDAATGADPSASTPGAGGSDGNGPTGDPAADEVGRWVKRAGRIVLDAPAW